MNNWYSKVTVKGTGIIIETPFLSEILKIYATFWAADYHHIRLGFFTCISEAEALIKHITKRSFYENAIKYL